MHLNSKILSVLFSLCFLTLYSQDPAEIPDPQIEPPEVPTVTEQAEPMRVKIDGIAAVVGDYVILDSDIEKTLIDLKNQGASSEDITR